MLTALLKHEHIENDMEVTAKPLKISSSVDGESRVSAVLAGTRDNLKVLSSEKARGFLDFIPSRDESVSC